MLHIMTKKLGMVMLAAGAIVIATSSADAGWWHRHHGSWGSSGSSGGSWGSSGSSGGSWGSSGSSGGSWGSYGGYSHYYGHGVHFWGHGHRHVSPSYYSHGGYWGHSASYGSYGSWGSSGSSGGSWGSSGSSGGVVIYDHAVPAQPAPGPVVNPMPTQPMPMDPMPGAPVDPNAAPMPGADTLPVLPNASRANSGSATLTVNVPADARLYVNGSATISKGANRKFVSRGLTAGYDYTYEVVAEGLRNGQPVRETKTVTVRAGDTKALAFNFAPANSVATSLTVHVPEDATVTLAGNRTAAKGAVRTYTTTALANGKTWNGYVVRATVQREGRTLTDEKIVNLAAGQSLTVEFDFDAPRLANAR